MTRSLPRLLLPAVLAVLALVVSGLALVVSPPGGPPSAQAATRVAKDSCRRIDPNLVNGVCLRYRTERGSGLTWIGSYRAPSGRVFFCIDYLYDSRLPRRARTVSTERLVNQLGDTVGDPEVAALNYLISRWAGAGSTGSDDRDAAIALIVREVMADGVRPGGLVVYPRGLKVGQRVRPPIGGLRGRVMALARDMWRTASAYRGPYAVRLDRGWDGPLRVGVDRVYRVGVLSDAGRWVPGVRLDLVCRGPIRCPRSITTAAGRKPLEVRPRETGRIAIRASAQLPAPDGLLYRERGWQTHGGATARDAGSQRGWIAQENRARAGVRATATIEKARPQVVTQTSEQVVRPGAAIHDVVEISGLPDGYRETVVATLYGPYPEQPGRGDCARSERAGRVRFEVRADGTYRTPSVVVGSVGYFTWVEDLPGDDRTRPHTTRCGIVAETSQVVPFTPRVETRTSRQRAHVGDRIHDRVVVSDLADTPATLAWALHGPLDPRDGSCRGLDWDGVPVVDGGAMDIVGDGRYRTPSTRLLRAGCYTYAQSIAATPVSEAAVSPPGLVAETTLTERRRPVVTTIASDQRALVGARIHDTVRLRGLSPRDEVVVRWTLHGPVAPRGASSCRRLDWDDAPVADRGALTARGNGRHRTAATRITTAGCYTYSEKVRATPSTHPTQTRPGVPLETALVTRPVTPFVPEVPTGAPAGTAGAGLPAWLTAWFGARGDDDGVPSEFVPTRRAEPRFLERWYRAPEPEVTARRAGAGTLTLDRLGIRAPVSRVGLDRGAMAVPNDRRRVGWLTSTASPDDRIGSSVISGHVSDRHDRPGALWRLRAARRGDVIGWRAADGEVHRYVVSSVRRYPRARGVPNQVFRTDGRRRLHLITCASRRETGGGGFHYADNLVVSAIER